MIYGFDGNSVLYLYSPLVACGSDGQDFSRKHGALRPQKPLRLIRDGEVGGSGSFISNTYSLHCHHQNDSAFRWAASCVSHLNVSVIVWAKSQDSVRKPLVWKGKERRAGAD